MSSRKSTVVFFLFTLCSCASLPALFLPTINDDRLGALVAEEAQQILRVSGNAHRADRYKFYLAEFPRDDILGLSFGEHRIFISYQLTRLAREHTGSLWLFRHTLAHEIAHDVLGHAKDEQMASLNAVRQSHARIKGADLGLPLFISFRNYSTAAELAADETAMGYWKKIGWDCGIWIKFFRGFLDQGYMGDPDHPTNERLNQAIKICESNSQQRDGNRQHAFQKGSDHETVSTNNDELSGRILRNRCLGAKTDRLSGKRPERRAAEQG